MYLAGGYDVDGYRHDLPRETKFSSALSFSKVLKTSVVA